MSETTTTPPTYRSVVDQQALLEVARSNAALIAKVDSLREMLIDHKSASQRQTDRTEVEMRAIKDDQREIDKKVDTTNAELMRRIDEIKGVAQNTQLLAQQTQKAVKEMDGPVGRWKMWENRIGAGWFLVAGTVLIIMKLWPAILTALGHG